MRFLFRTFATISFEYHVRISELSRAGIRARDTGVCVCVCVCRVDVQLMRELEKVVRPNVVHFNVVDPKTTIGKLYRS